MRKLVVLLVLATGALALGQPAGAMVPRKQPVVSGFFRGQTVRYFDYGQIKLKPGNKLAPIWTVTNGVAAQHNIVDTVPGRADYSPLWQLNKVTWAAGKTPRLLTSAAAVRKAQAAGEVTVASTTTVVNCPLLGFGQKLVAGFARGKTIHYYDLGPVKVAPGNTVLPLWAVTNGVAGQHNVADVEPGRTAYPPLWAIVQVTWKAGKTPRLLTSYEQIASAQAAGEVSLAQTSLVVNCPLV